jgi:hypothetical protein
MKGQFKLKYPSDNLCPHCHSRIFKVFDATDLFHLYIDSFGDICILCFYCNQPITVEMEEK